MQSNHSVDGPTKEYGLRPIQSAMSSGRILNMDQNAHPIFMDRKQKVPPIKIDKSMTPHNNVGSAWDDMNNLHTPNQDYHYQRRSSIEQADIDKQIKKNSGYGNQMQTMMLSPRFDGSKKGL